jgi:hypothetical protein
MVEKNNTFLLLTLLIIHTIFIFLKTITVILFDQHLLNLDEKYLTFINENYIDYFIGVILVIQAFLSSIILYRKKSHTDILTFILAYLVFYAFLHFYYYYLLWRDQNPIMREKIHTYQDIHTIVLFFISGYMLTYIFRS